MASDYLLEIDGIKGESRDSKHPGAIEVLSFSWGVSQTASVTGEPERQVQNFSFTADVGKASPILMLACATGKSPGDATLFVRKPDGKRLEYLEIKLEDVLISSYQTCGSGNEIPTDQFSLNFAKIEFTYNEETADGSVKPVTASFMTRSTRATLRPQSPGKL